MPETKLRKASASEETLEALRQGASEGQLAIKSANSNPVEPIIDRYPFENQEIITGELSYEEESEITIGRTIHIDYELRTGSNLFLIEFNTDIDSINPIIDQLVGVTSDAVTIYRNLHAPEDALWDFLMAADRVLQLKVLDGGKEIPYDEVEGVDTADVIGEYAIENAAVGFVKNNKEIYVEYRDGSLQVETDWDEGREYIIQTFEREVLGD